jgi:hypothetical protein
MNWLHRNQATVSCDKRTVKLVSPFGKEVVTKLYLPELEEGACHHLSVDDKESNPIEAIRIVSEFTIELILGTAPYFQESLSSVRTRVGGTQEAN